MFCQKRLHDRVPQQLLLVVELITFVADSNAFPWPRVLNLSEGGKETVTCRKHSKITRQLKARSTLCLLVFSLLLWHLNFHLWGQNRTRVACGNLTTTEDVKNS